MTNCLNATTTAANAGKPVMAVYLDTTIAFDRISCLKLINKIKSYEVTDSMLS